MAVQNGRSEFPATSVCSLLFSRFLVSGQPTIAPLRAKAHTGSRRTVGSEIAQLGADLKWRVPLISPHRAVTRRHRAPAPQP